MWYARRITSTELLSVYSIEIDKIPVFLIKLGSVLDYVLPHSIPWTFRNSIIRDNNYITNLLEPFSNSDTRQCNISQRYFISITPESLDWTSAYKEDINTRFITSKLLDSQYVAWNDRNLSKVNSAYQLPLKDNTIQVMNKNLVLLKPILANHRHDMLVIVSISLRRKMCSHYHSGPSGGHMKWFKTLYIIQLKFSWSKLREYIKQWVKNCVHCVAYNI